MFVQLISNPNRSNRIWKLIRIIIFIISYSKIRYFLQK
jgi:hypothetical protein